MGGFLHALLPAVLLLCVGVGFAAVRSRPDDDHFRPCIVQLYLSKRCVPPLVLLKV